MSWINKVVKSSISERCVSVNGPHPSHPTQVFAKSSPPRPVKKVYRVNHSAYLIRYAQVLSRSAVCVLTVFTNNQVSRQARLMYFEFSTSISYSSTHSYIHMYIYFLTKIRLSILHNLCLNKHLIITEPVFWIKNKICDLRKIPTEDLLNSFSSFCSNGKISSVNRALDWKKEKKVTLLRSIYRIMNIFYFKQTCTLIKIYIISLAMLKFRNTWT